MSDLHLAGLTVHVCTASCAEHTCWNPAHEARQAAGSRFRAWTIPRCLEHLHGHAGEQTIKHLLSRSTHREFGYAALLTMLAVYFGGAVWASGSAIASGLFVPMLVIGSCVGRLVGLIAVDIAASHGYGSDGCAPACVQHVGDV